MAFVKYICGTGAQTAVQNSGHSDGSGLATEPVYDNSTLIFLSFESRYLAHQNISVGHSIDSVES